MNVRTPRTSNLILTPGYSGTPCISPRDSDRVARQEKYAHRRFSSNTDTAGPSERGNRAETGRGPALLLLIIIFIRAPFYYTSTMYMHIHAHIYVFHIHIHVLSHAWILRLYIVTNIEIHTVT